MRRFSDLLLSRIGARHCNVLSIFISGGAYATTRDQRNKSFLRRFFSKKRPFG